MSTLQSLFFYMSYLTNFFYTHFDIYSYHVYFDILMFFLFEHVLQPFFTGITLSLFDNIFVCLFCAFCFFYRCTFLGLSCSFFLSSFTLFSLRGSLCLLYLHFFSLCLFVSLCLCLFIPVSLSLYLIVCPLTANRNSPHGSMCRPGASVDGSLNSGPRRRLVVCLRACCFCARCSVSVLGCCAWVVGLCEPWRPPLEAAAS